MDLIEKIKNIFKEDNPIEEMETNVIIRLLTSIHNQFRIVETADGVVVEDY